MVLTLMHDGLVGEPRNETIRRCAIAALLVGVGLVTACGVYQVRYGFPSLLTPPTKATFTQAMSLALAAALCIWAVSAIAGRSMLTRVPRRWWIPITWWATVLFTAVSIALVWQNPHWYTGLTIENGPAEVLSFLALMGAAAGYGLLAVRAAEGRIFRQWPAVLLAVGCFLAGMEEISWGQHVLHFKTPAGLAAVNAQHEFNLHNLATKWAENSYYAGGFVWLILLPWLSDLRGGALVLTKRAPWPTPSRAALYVAAPAFACNYGLWHVVPVQLAFWMTLWILCWYALAQRRRLPAHERAVVTVVLALYVVTQVDFILFGGNLNRPWGATELKETIIPAGLFVAALCSHMAVDRQRRNAH